MNLLASEIVVFILFSGLFCAFSLTDGNGHVPGIRVSSSQLSRALPPDKTQCDAGKFIDCSNCSTRIVCDWQRNILMSVYCRGLTPFCNNGFCVMQKPQSCIDPNEPSPLCPGEGFFPRKIKTFFSSNMKL